MASPPLPRGERGRRAKPQSPRAPAGGCVTCLGVIDHPLRAPHRPFSPWGEGGPSSRRLAFGKTGRMRGPYAGLLPHGRYDPARDRYFAEDRNSRISKRHSQDSQDMLFDMRLERSARHAASHQPPQSALPRHRESRPRTSHEAPGGGTSSHPIDDCAAATRGALPTSFGASSILWHEMLNSRPFVYSPQPHVALTAASCAPHRW